MRDEQADLIEASLASFDRAVEALSVRFDELRESMLAIDNQDEDVRYARRVDADKLLLALKSDVIALKTS